MGASNYYCDSCEDGNTSSGGWRDYLCPVEINLANKLWDGKWHALKIVYTNTAADTSLGQMTHRPCCPNGSGYIFFGMTLYLGCDIEVGDGLQIPRIAFPGKFQRVNLYGVPLPEPSPTGETESDEPQNGFFIDMYNLAPTASFPEVSIPIEGGELALEFRRDGGVRSAETSTNTFYLPITYPTDDLLGLGWNSNLSARAIISRNPGCAGTDPSSVTITDSGGTSYHYLLSGSRFLPEVYESQANAAIRATPTLFGSTLTLTLKHGTKYVYSKVGTFYPRNVPPANGGGDDYYRLDSVQDRNGNAITYDHTTGLPYPAGSMLVLRIKESLHPERAITFSYVDKNGTYNQNGYDWGIRLSKVTDPQGNFIEYNYTLRDFGTILYGDPPENYGDPNIPNDARQRWLLTSVTYPQVTDGDSSPLVHPVQFYDYDIRVTQGPVLRLASSGEIQEKPFSRMLHVGIKTAWQGGDFGFTQFTYMPPGQEADFPLAIYPLRFVAPGPAKYLINLETQKVLTVTEVLKPDGSAAHFQHIARAVVCDPQPCPDAQFHVRTGVIDARDMTISFDWTGVGRMINASTDPFDSTTGQFLYWNQTGFATVIDHFERISNNIVPGTVTYDYSNDLFGNLLEVVDLSGNHFAYTYGDPAFPEAQLQSRKSNQPTLKTVFKDPARSISTAYTYEPIFNKLSSVTDADGKVTSYSIDAKGNRTALSDETEHLVRSTRVTYDTDGFLLSTTDAEGRRTEFTREFFPGPDPVALYYRVTTVVDPTGLGLKTVKNYDRAGNLLSEVPPEGFVPGHVEADYTTTYQYDALRRLVRVTKPSVNSWNQDGLMTPGPTLEESFYDLRGNLVKKKAGRQPGGQDVVATLYSYDAMNRLVSTAVVASPTQTILAFKSYNNMGLLSEEIDANGNTVDLFYDALLRLQYKIHRMPIGGMDLVEEYQYETSDGRRLNSGSGAFAYNLGWKPIRVFSARILEWAMRLATDSTYDEFYRLVQVVRRRGDDPASDPLPIDPSVPGRNEGIFGGITRPAEPQENFEYNDVGKAIRHNVQLANNTASTLQSTYTFYDEFDRPTAVVLDVDGDGNDAVAYNPLAKLNDPSTLSADAQDIVTRTGYDQTDKVAQVTDPEGRTSTKSYDRSGRLEKEVGPLVLNPATNLMVLPAVKTTYDANGAVIETRGPYPDGPTAAGRQVTNSYDKQGRLEKTIVDLNGNGSPEESADITTLIRYDLLGNRVQAVDPNGTITAFVYDGANRKTSQIRDSRPGGLNARTNFEYDLNSNITAITDPLQILTEFEYDELNRVLVERKASGTLDELLVEKAYDENGNLLQLTVHNGPQQLQITKYTYDDFDRPTKEELPGTPLAVKVNDYFRDGKLSKTTDPKGQAVTYEYDLARRVTESHHAAEESRSFEYDRAGNVLQVTDAQGVSTYAYDSHYRLVSETRQTTGQPNYTVQNQYDLEGHRTKLTYPGPTGPGRVLTQVYDPAGRLTSISDSTAAVTTAHQYDKNGNLTRLRWPTNSDASYVLQTTSTFDPLNRLSSRIATKRTGGTVFSETPGYDLAGNIRTLTETINTLTRVVTYGYDQQYRLTSEAWTGNSYAYTYDGVGNRLQKRFQASDTYNYSYNARSELQSVAYSVSGGAPTTTNFTYDLNGNRATKTVSGVTTTYTWDTNNRLKEVKNGATTVFQASYDYRTRRQTITESGSTKYFVYDGGLCVEERANGSSSSSTELVNGMGLGGGIGGVLYEVRGSTRSHFVYNQVGHNVVQLGTTGTVTAYDRYEAFGNRFSYLASANKRLANTKELDSSTGLYNHGFRYYEPSLGQYISRDPVGYQDGYNLYSYVNANPIIRIDPKGLWGIWIGGYRIGNDKPWLVFDSESVKTLQGGVSVTTSALTFGATDKIGLTDSGQYQGSEYTASRVAGTVAREALITAGTLGVGAAARAGSGTAQFAVNAMTATEVATGAYQVGNGIEKIAIEGEYVEGGLDVVGGGLRAGGGFLSAANASKTIAKVENEAEKAADKALQAVTPAPKGVPNPGGRLGSPTTRAQVEAIAEEMEGRGWTITGGGGRLPEEYLPGPGGARAGSSFPDITATKGGRTLRVNTVDTLKDGVTPTAREARNAARIRSQTPGDHLLSVPKPQPEG